MFQRLYVKLNCQLQSNDYSNLKRNDYNAIFASIEFLLFIFKAYFLFSEKNMSFLTILSIIKITNNDIKKFRKISLSRTHKNYDFYLKKY